MTWIPTWDTVVKHWKSTVSGLSGTLTVFGGILTASPDWAHSAGLTTRQAFWITVILGSIRVYVGAASKDSTQMQVHVPADSQVNLQVPTGSKIQQTTDITSPGETK